MIDLTKGIKLILVDPNHPKTAGRKFSMDKPYEIIAAADSGGRRYINLVNDAGERISFWKEDAEAAFAQEGQNLKTQVMGSVPPPPAAAAPSVPAAPATPVPQPVTAAPAPLPVNGQENAAPTVATEQKADPIVKKLNSQISSLTEENNGLKSVIVATEKECTVLREALDKAEEEIRYHKKQTQETREAVRSLSVIGAIGAVKMLRKVGSIIITRGEAGDYAIVSKIDDFPELSISGNRPLENLDTELGDMILRAYSENGLKVQAIQTFNIRIDELTREKEQAIKNLEKQVKAAEAPNTAEIKPPVKGKSSAKTPAVPAPEPPASDIVPEPPAEIPGDPGEFPQEDVPPVEEAMPPVDEDVPPVEEASAPAADPEIAQRMAKLEDENF